MKLLLSFLAFAALGAAPAQADEYYGTPNLIPPGGAYYAADPHFARPEFYSKHHGDISYWRHRGEARRIDARDRSDRDRWHRDHWDEGQEWH
jgi:hypothetical protein